MTSPIRALASTPRRQPKDVLGDGVRARETNDLVFGVTGYIGSGLSHVAKALGEKLRELRFELHEVTLSDLLAKAGGVQRTTSKTVDDVVPLQDAGDRLREEYGPSIVAGLGIRDIYKQRKTLQEPRVFVMDSIKHPKEVEVLRAVYGRGFYLIGVLCNYEERLHRLKLKFKSEQDKSRIEDLMRRDAAGGEEHGQQVRKTLHLADFFIANDAQDGRDNEGELGDALERFLQAVTGTHIVRPNRDEKGMFAAWGASLRSSCMSRQVGAAIMGAGVEVLATGTNDPPAPRGGLYTDDSPDDRRCFNWPDRELRPFCRNDKKKREIYAEVLEQLGEVGVLRDGATSAQIEEALGRTRIRDLIEFSRAIHAEMDALLALARRGVGVPQGGTLYCTTFPCHSCARHIVAAGLSEVVYLEPYTKSLALELHADALREISVKGRDGDGPESEDPRVVLRLFTGFAPRRFAALFEKRRDLKDGHGVLVVLGGSAAHADPVLNRSFLQLEEELAGTVESALQGTSADAEQGPTDPSRG
jgi:deoxycytidylate deaminase